MESRKALGNPEERHNLEEKEKKIFKEEEQALNLMGINPGNLEERNNLSEQEDVSTECKSC